MGDAGLSRGEAGPVPVAVVAFGAFLGYSEFAWEPLVAASEAGSFFHIDCL